MSLNSKIKTFFISESGRSMVEMLGTLAIIGILSIGGIAGYRYAIDKHRANETMDELNKRAIIYSAQVLYSSPTAGEILANGEYGDKTTLGYSIEANNSYYPNEFEVTLTNYPSEVCRDILKNYTIPYQIVVANKVYDPVSDNYSICGNDGETAPETLFIYKTDLQLIAEENIFEGIEKTYGDFQEASYINSEITSYEASDEITVAICTEGEEFKAYGSCYPCDQAYAYYIDTQEEKSFCEKCPEREVLGNSCAKKCIKGEEFRVGTTCYTCDRVGRYKISTETEYEMCRACGRAVTEDGYCVTGCMAGEVLNKSGVCVPLNCFDNSQCESTEFCKFDVGLTNDSCVKPIAGVCTPLDYEEKELEGLGIVTKATEKLDFWSSQNFCERVHGKIPTLNEIGCKYVLWHGSYACTNSNLPKFYGAFGQSAVHLWTSDTFSKEPAECASGCVYMAVNGFAQNCKYTSKEYAICLKNN